MTSPQRTVLEASDNGGSTLPRSGWALVLPGRDDRRLPRNQIASSVDSLAFPSPHGGLGTSDIGPRSQHLFLSVFVGSPPVNLAQS